jgi:hypothetical protein
MSRLGNFIRVLFADILIAIGTIIVLIGKFFMDVGEWISPYSDSGEFD